MQAYISSIWGYRFFWYSLVENDLRQRYRGSILGLGWSFLQPLCMTVVLCIVFGGIFQQDYRFFGPFLLAGLAVWNLLSQSISQGCNCFFMGESYIRQFPVPMAIYPLRSILSLGFHFLVALGLVVVLSLFFQGWPGIVPILSLIPALVTLLIVTWSLACLFGIATVNFRDTRHLTEVALQILFYLTPVMYPPAALEGRRIAYLLKYNPFTPFLELIRDPLVFHRVPSVETLLAANALTLLVLLTAAYTLKVWERKIIFHL